MAEAIKFISLDVWSKNEEWLRDYIGVKDAESLKTAALSPDGKKIRLYKITNPTASSNPAFEIEIPAPDLEAYIQKVSGATADNLVTLNADGSIKDSGKKLSELPTKTEMNTEIQKQIEEKSNLNIQKEIVTTVPAPEDANDNTFYLIKVTEATGNDKYEIWTKIGSEVVMIDDTSFDISGYVTKNELTEQLETTVSDAVSQATEAAKVDAKTKADAALASAKQYTDEQLSPISTRLTDAETTLNSHSQSITTINNSLTTYEDRLTSVEQTSGSNLKAATEAEALQIFNSIFTLEE